MARGTAAAKRAAKAVKPKEQKKEVVRKQPTASESESQETTGLTAYEQLVIKVNENKRKRGAVNTPTSKGKRSKKGKQLDEVAAVANMANIVEDANTAEARVFEDDNFMDIRVTDDQSKEFPSQSEEESESESEGEMDQFREESSKNNNATTLNVRSLSATVDAAMALPQSIEMEPGKICDEGPSTSTVTGNTRNDRNLEQTLNLVQAFMLQKGLIDKSLTEEEMQDFISSGGMPEVTSEKVPKQDSKKSSVKGKKRVSNKATGENIRNMPRVSFLPEPNNSETTIYKQAISQDKPSMDCQIEQFISQVRNDTLQRKVSSSSEEFMDTSGESVHAMILDTSVIAGAAGGIQDESHKGIGSQEQTANSELQANYIIKEAERSKAHLFDMPGKNPLFRSTTEMDEDFDMIDAHVDEAMKRKIQCFKYIDLSKLLSKNKMNSDDQHLEIVNRNGMSFLAPVSDHDTIQISTYNKWEQAFRVYSNVLTLRFPEKASELLQYNHTIHTASMAYVWENIYSYDKEFRLHIRRHPTRPWNVILQQAWTMILKIKYFSGKRGNNKNSPIRG